MHALLTPLLQKAYAVFGVCVIIYGLSLALLYSPWNKERLYRQLLEGNAQTRASAGFDLAYLNAEEQLLRALKSSSPAARSVAANSLWGLWTRAAGHRAFKKMQAAERAADRNALPEALQILSGVTTSYPRFAEAWNRRATVYCQLGQFGPAMADAERAVRLNPNHFGAWQGLGLCHLHLGDMEAARRCLQQALRITPHDEALQELLSRCGEPQRASPPHKLLI